MHFNGSNKVITGTIDTEASPEKVWGLLPSSDAIANWHDDAINVTHLDAQDTFQVGTRFLIARRGLASWCVVTVMEPLRRLGWTEETDGKATVFVEFLLVPLGEGRTRPTHSKTPVVWASPALRCRRWCLRAIDNEPLSPP